MEGKIIVSLAPLDLLSLSSHCGRLLLLHRETFPSGKGLTQDKKIEGVAFPVGEGG